MLILPKKLILKVNYFYKKNTRTDLSNASFTKMLYDVSFNIDSAKEVSLIDVKSLSKSRSYNKYKIKIKLILFKTFSLFIIEIKTSASNV